MPSLVLVTVILILYLTLSAASAFSISASAEFNPEFRYVALYKPALTLCTLRSDAPRAERKQRERRDTLRDLDLPEGLHIVGRLDRDSEGLLLLTDDGQFTRNVAEPGTNDGDNNDLKENGCHKTYWALVKGQPISDTAMERMKQGGLPIRGAKTKPPIAVNLLPDDTAKLLPKPALGMDRTGSWIEIILSEGRNRQVRRITADAGHPTIRLVRVAIGSLSLGDMQPGEWKFIARDDVLPAGYWLH